MVDDITNEAYLERFASGDEGAYQLIDVREEDEYAAGHIPGAMNIPLSEFMARYDEVDEDMPALFVCNTGVRSSQAAFFLAGMGCENLYNLEEGTKGWIKQGHAVEREDLD